MGLFNWSAPYIHKYGQRWTPEDIELIAVWLSPYLDGGGAVLDVGGGSGGLATRLADHLGCRVTVLDPTPELLGRIPQHPLVEGVLGVAQDMPFDDNEFDALVIADAFHHFSEQDVAVREMRRVVRCGGAVLVLEIDPSGWLRLLVLGERLLGEPGGFRTPAEMCALMRSHGIEGGSERQKGASYRFLGVVQP